MRLKPGFAYAYLWWCANWRNQCLRPSRFNCQYQVFGPVRIRYVHTVPSTLDFLYYTFPEEEFKSSQLTQGRLSSDTAVTFPGFSGSASIFLFLSWWRLLLPSFLLLPEGESSGRYYRISSDFSLPRRSGDLRRLGDTFPDPIVGAYSKFVGDFFWPHGDSSWLGGNFWWDGNFFYWLGFVTRLLFFLLQPATFSDLK